jgi:hypothetical protein
MASVSSTGLIIELAEREGIGLGLRPPVAPAVRATGRTGSTHGDSAVAAPATRANSVRSVT